MFSIDCVFSCLINAAFLRQVGEAICICGSAVLIFLRCFFVENSPPEQLFPFVSLPCKVLLGTDPIVYLRLKVQITIAPTNRSAFFNSVYENPMPDENIADYMHVSSSAWRYFSSAFNDRLGSYLRFFNKSIFPK